ncbi:hypothetical protein [Kribbella sp. NPDC003557]|uniref:hypothetical protein n=1 Tax=Kribbella sp. NPDC003557 TaxID=3154449 RepID=UPI0033B58471
MSLPFARRRRERLAVEAVTVLCYEAFLAIRGSAYTGQVRSASDVGPVDVDVMEWMRSVADACHNLPPSLRPSVAGGRKQRATDAVQYLLATASPLQRRWILATLAGNGIEVGQLTG